MPYLGLVAVVVVVVGAILLGKHTARPKPRILTFAETQQLALNVMKAMDEHKGTLTGEKLIAWLAESD